MSYPIPPPASCAIQWQPSALAPVFYGYRDYGLGQNGAPVPLRVFFPSIDPSPATASILAGCGRYPAVLFAHGHCPNDAANYQRWILIPGQLARAGYVVVVLQLPDISTRPHPTHSAQDAMSEGLDWLRQRFEHRQVLMPPEATGVVGHSFGALHAAQFALTHSDVAAYAALSADWHNWAGTAGLPIVGMQQPKLLIEGGGELFPGLTEPEWNALSPPKHRAVFKKGDHWDYLPLEEWESLPCISSRGPCPHVPAATADLLTMFFGKYVPPELSPHLPPRIPSSLFPPRLVLSPKQKPFATNYLVGMRALDTHSDCGIALTPPAYYSSAAGFAIGLANI